MSIWRKPTQEIPDNIPRDTWVVAKFPNGIEPIHISDCGVVYCDEWCLVSDLLENSKKWEELQKGFDPIHCMKSAMTTSVDTLSELIQEAQSKGLYDD